MEGAQTDRSMGRVVIGTRQSRLALWQAEHIAARLRAFYPTLEVALRPLVTQGDRALDRPLPEIGGKGVFTAELEAALLAGEIDLAVHSLKDLPTAMAAEFTIGAVPERAAPFDALVSRANHTLDELPLGATVGTSSLRRAAQLRAIRPDLRTLSLRGNVPTRLEKLRRPDGPYDAIVLALAGLERLDLAAEVTEVLVPQVMLPAPAQGALAVQCRSGDEAVRALLAPLDHAPTRRAVQAERAFLSGLGSGCSLPVAALATSDEAGLRLTGRVCAPDGSQAITVEGAAPPDGAEELGHALAMQALSQGAAELLAAVVEGIGGLPASLADGAS